MYQIMYVREKGRKCEIEGEKEKKKKNENFSHCIKQTFSSLCQLFSSVLQEATPKKSQKDKTDSELQKTPQNSELNTNVSAIVKV